MKTDRDILHYISENPELDDLLNRLAISVSQKTIKWRNDKKAAKMEAIATMRDKGLCGDYDGIKHYLKNNLVMMEIKGDILGKTMSLGRGCCKMRR